MARLIARGAEGTLPVRADLTLFPEDEAGQNVVEYGLLIATIVVVVLLALNAFGHLVQPWFAGLAARITTTGT